MDDDRTDLGGPPYGGSHLVFSEEDMASDGR